MAAPSVQRRRRARRKKDWDELLRGEEEVKKIEEGLFEEEDLEPEIIIEEKETKPKPKKGRKNKKYNGL